MIRFGSGLGPVNPVWVRYGSGLKSGGLRFDSGLLRFTPVCGLWLSSVVYGCPGSNPVKSGSKSGKVRFEVRFDPVGQGRMGRMGRMVLYVILMLARDGWDG